MAVIQTNRRPVYSLQIEHMKHIKRLFIFIIIIIIKQMIERRYIEREKIRRKIKYFKPIIHEGTFFNHLSWEQRDKPLTDEELKIL